MEEKDKQQEFPLKIYAEGKPKGFTRVPNAFVHQLMERGNGIPASFWKFLLILWSDIADYKPGWTAKRTMTQFHMSKPQAMKWTATLYVSGLFVVKYGRRDVEDKAAIPTWFQYREDATLEEWIIFIQALRDQILEDKREHWSPTGDIWMFRFELAMRIDEMRVKAGLPQVNQTYLNHCVKLGLAKFDKEGALHWKRRLSDRVKVLTAKDVEDYYPEIAKEREERRLDKIYAD